MIRKIWERLCVRVNWRNARRGAGAAAGFAGVVVLLLYWPPRWVPDWAAKNQTAVIEPGQKLPPGVKPGPSPSPRPVAHVRGEDRVVQLETKGSLGHACPISPTDALTAEHVALEDDFKDGSNTKRAPYVIWGDMLGNTGTVQWQWSDLRRDVSLVRVVPGTPLFGAHLRRAGSSPPVGAKVYVVGYDWGNGLGDYTVEAKVTGNRAGSLVYSTTPGGGSSGGCVLNESGEFVAIHVASVRGEGLGLLVVEDWAEVPDMFLAGGR